jgi:hypothetical protein
MQTSLIWGIVSPHPVIGRRHNMTRFVHLAATALFALTIALTGAFSIHSW